MRPYTRYPACNTAGFFFAFYFFREGGPVGHKHNLYANRDWGGEGGWARRSQAGCDKLSQRHYVTLTQHIAVRGYVTLTSGARVGARG